MNLAPSTEKKVGSTLDLAIAIALLIVDEQIPPECARDLAFIGELSLDGRVRPVQGVAPMVMALRESSLRQSVSHSTHDGTSRNVSESSRSPLAIVVPIANEPEARIVHSTHIFAAESLAQIVGCLRDGDRWPQIDESRVDVSEANSDIASPGRSTADLAEVRGQSSARLGLELAAAGGHHLLLVGSPGSGKTMLAHRLPGILPSLDDDVALEATLIRSAHGEWSACSGLVREPPLRMPHHTATTISIIGGGSSSMRPGEVSLAHGGVLFLDELGEFSPSTLDGLRQPLEEGVVRISRAHARAVLPARFILVGATNPCPCGGGGPGSCECDETALSKYRRRFSGPLLDRFDVRVLVCRPGVDELLGVEPAESTAVVRERVRISRRRAFDRQGFLNARLSGDDLERFAPLNDSARALLRAELESGRLTGRGLHRVRRVARTLADRDGEVDVIGEDLIASALALRARVAPSRSQRLR
jgi:magnesium chelatase family protein